MAPAERTVASACLLVALAWALLLPLTAYAASRRPPAPASAVLAIAVYGVGSAICHQRSERSFSTAGVPWPVCARCSGIYFGAAAAAAIALLWRRRRPIGPRLLVLGAALLPSLATLFWEWAGGGAPSNTIRLIAGLPIGAVVILVIADAGQAPGVGARGVR